jgi:hypothetical protein
MAIVNGYASLDDMHAWLETGPDPGFDPLLADAVNAASRGIDNYTHRHFYVIEGEQRVFSGSVRIRGERVRLFGAWNDLATIASVEDDSGDITTDVVPWPANRQRGELWPIRGLVGNFRGRVRVTGDWGWPEVPEPIREATVLQAARLVKRRRSPEGVVGLNTFGTVKLGQIDPDAKRMVKPYRIRAGVG